MSWNAASTRCPVVTALKKRGPIQAGHKPQPDLDNPLTQCALAVTNAVAEWVLFSGTNPWEFDDACLAFGYSMGPLALEDSVGLDRIRAYRQRWHINTANPINTFITQRMLAEGRVGRSHTVGWFRYPGGQGPVDDPLVEDLFREEAHFAKVARADHSQEEIQSLFLLGLSLGLTELGLSHRDLHTQTDAVFVQELGFPVDMRGPLAFGRLLGDTQLKVEAKKLAKHHSAWWPMQMDAQNFELPD